MIFPRLRIARDLLSEDGVIFVSIDDHEVSNLKKVMDDVFGAHCFIADLVWQKSFRAQMMPLIFQRCMTIFYATAKRILCKILKDGELDCFHAVMRYQADTRILTTIQEGYGHPSFFRQSRALRVCCMKSLLQVGVL